MSPVEAAAVLKLIDRYKQHEGLSEEEIQLQATARRALGIPTREPGLSSGVRNWRDETAIYHAGGHS